MVIENRSVLSGDKNVKSILNKQVATGIIIRVTKYL
jgi:hypothetical protein